MFKKAYIGNPLIICSKRPGEGACDLEYKKAYSIDKSAQNERLKKKEPTAWKNADLDKKEKKTRECLIKYSMQNDKEMNEKGKGQCQSACKKAEICSPIDLTDDQCSSSSIIIYYLRP